MRTFKEAITWAKYGAIILYSDLTGKGTVDWFGATYVVSRGIAKRIR